MIGMYHVGVSKNERLVEQFVEDIVHGDKPKQFTLVWVALNIVHDDRMLINKFITLLEQHHDNPNCMYHLSILFDHKKMKQEAEIALTKAIELGSLDAKFDFLVNTYEHDWLNVTGMSNITDSLKTTNTRKTADKSKSEHEFTINKHFVKETLDMIKDGYRLQHHFNVKYFVYYSYILEVYVEQLEMRNEKLEMQNTELESKLLEEQLRPPQDGGSEFEKAKIRFEGQT